MSKYLTPKAVAEQFGVSYDKVFVWIRSGELRAINVAATVAKKPRWMIKPEEVEAFEKRRTTTPVVQQVKRRKTSAVSFF